MFYTLTVHYYNTSSKVRQSVLMQYTYNFRTLEGLKQILAIIDYDIKKGDKVYHVAVNRGILFD